MIASTLLDLDTWAAQVVTDPPAPVDDDRLGDWAVEVVDLAREKARVS